MTQVRRMLQFSSTKTYTHEEGLSCCFRQWRAKDTHCQYLHGYALKVQIEFWSLKLDDRNWVVNFGDMKDIKAWLKETFDHKTVIAEDDPALKVFQDMNRSQGPGGKLVQLVVLPHVGMEKFAEHIFFFAEEWLKERGYDKRVCVHHVAIWEHATNSATVFNPDLVRIMDEQRS